MLILMKFPAVERESPDDPNKLALEAFERAESAYLDAASDGEAYLRQMDPGQESRAAELLGFHDGAAEPEYVINLAMDWNKHIEERFDALLARMQAAAGLRPDGTRAWLDCPPSDAYKLKKAVMALDGHVYDFAEEALLVNEYRYLTAVLQPDELRAIQDGPSDYVVLEVFPK